MSPKTKKTFKYVGGGVGGLFVLLIAAGMFIEPPQNQDGAPGLSSSGDSRLDELRERSAELDDVYDVGDANFAQPDSNDDLFASVGELSDFDQFKEPEPSHEQDLEQGTFFSDDVHSDDQGVVSPDEAMVDQLNERDGEVFGEISPSDFESPPSIAEEDMQQLRDDVFAAVSAMELELRDDIQHLETNVQQQAASQLDVDFAALREELRALQASHTELRSQLHDTPDDQAELSERVAQLEQQLQQRNARAQRPSDSTLRNLYRLERIQGRTAVLVGQNTGTRFTFSEGDSLAYNGTISVIRGDSVTLRWPSTSVTLAIY